MIKMKNNLLQICALISLLSIFNVSLYGMQRLVPAQQRNVVAPTQQVAKKSAALTISQLSEIIELLARQEDNAVAVVPVRREFNDLLTDIKTRAFNNVEIVDNQDNPGLLDITFNKDQSTTVTLSQNASGELRALVAEEKKAAALKSKENIEDISFLELYKSVKVLQKKEMEKFLSNAGELPMAQTDYDLLKFDKLFQAMHSKKFNSFSLNENKANDTWDITLKSSSNPALKEKITLSSAASDELYDELQKKLMQSNYNVHNKNSRKDGPVGPGGKRSVLNNQNNKQRNNNGYYGDDAKDSKKDEDEKKKKKGLGGPIVWPDKNSPAQNASQNYGGGNYNNYGGGGGRSGGGYRPSSGGYYGGGYDGYGSGGSGGRAPATAFTGTGSSMPSSSKSGKEEKVTPTKGGHEVTRFDSAPYEYKKRTTKEIDNLENYFYGKSIKKEPVSRPNRYSEAVKKSAQLESARKNKEDNNVKDHQKDDSTKNQKDGIVATITDAISACVNSVISFFNWLYESTFSYF